VGSDQDWRVQLPAPTGIASGQRRTEALLFLVSSSRRDRLATAWTTSTDRSSAIFVTKSFGFFDDSAALKFPRSQAAPDIADSALAAATDERRPIAIGRRLTNPYSSTCTS